MSATAISTSPLATAPQAPAAKAAAAPLGLIEQMLADQARLTAVDRFSQVHDKGRHAAPGRLYADLIPLSAPGPGQQYAFEVDLDACSGCKACVTACHNLNGLDEDETWRDVGVLVGGSTSLPVIQHVTSSCHHCLEPACMDGCPVLAYEKDPVTGIVRHLDDQCIGCQYCVLKCPYDAPKYNRAKGIVRKCDMCAPRLAVGEAPACVQGCPNQAIRIRVVDRRQVVDECEAGAFLPAAPDPAYTLPATTYKSSRPLPRNARAGDHYASAPQQAHWPLVVMLVLTQLSVGAFCTEQAQAWVGADRSALAARPLHAVAALALGLLALAASILHLGRPLYAFRAVIGLRTSWLSREIVAFGLFAALAAIDAACLWLDHASSASPRLNQLGAAVAVVGLAGVLCSVMVYHDTRRVFWRGPETAARFLGTTFVLGIMTTLLIALYAARGMGLRDLSIRRWGGAACVLASAGSAMKIAFEMLILRHLHDRTLSPMRRTAQLMIGPLRGQSLARVALGTIGGVGLPLLTWLCLNSNSPGSATIIFSIAFGMSLAGEMLERCLFFRAVVAPKMPGGFDS